eukprot:SAG11_NODE_1758_length_4306_cov_2.946993_3_plen_92_part_00
MPTIYLGSVDHRGDTNLALHLHRRRCYQKAVFCRLRHRCCDAFVSNGSHDTWGCQMLGYLTLNIGELTRGRIGAEHGRHDVRWVLLVVGKV